MMRYIATFAAIVISVSSAAAQEISIGGHLGLTGSTLSGDTDVGTFDSNLGLMAGGFVDVGLTEWFAIRSGLTYIGKGAEATEQVPGFDEFFTHTTRLHYIQLPVLAAVRAPSRSLPVTPSLFMGPAVSYLASSQNAENDGDFEKSGGFKSMTFGLIFGGGLSWGALSIDARYDLGLTKAGEPRGARPEIPSSCQPPTCRNRAYPRDLLTWRMRSGTPRSFAVTLGYTIPFR